MDELTDEERRAIERLQAAIDAMPSTLWLFSNGSLNVMKRGPNGEVVYTDCGGVDPDYIAEDDFDIYSEGGGW